MMAQGGIISLMYDGIPGWSGAVGWYSRRFMMDHAFLVTTNFRYLRHAGIGSGQGRTGQPTGTLHRHLARIPVG